MTRETIGPRRANRSLMGLRVEAYIRSAGWSKRRLAQAIGVTPAYLSDCLAGRRAFGIEKLKSIAGALGNCRVTDLVDNNITIRWVGVQHRLIDGLSCALGQPWYYFEMPEWANLLPEECFSKVINCFRVALEEVRAFTTSTDAAGITIILKESVNFAERAHLKGVPDASQLLFDLCDCLVHCLSYALLPGPLFTAATPYLTIMNRVFADTKDLAIGKRLWEREGDVLKICAGENASALLVANEVLQRAPLLARTEFELIRNRVVVGAKTSSTEPALMRLLKMAEEGLDSCGASDDAQRHLLEAMGEACAHQFTSMPRDKRYCKLALECYERARILRPPTTPTEILLRVKRLPLKYASCGIADLIHSDGREVREVKRLARLVGNARVAQQADALEDELKRKKIIRG